MKKHYILIFLLLLLAGCTFFRSPGRDRCDKILSREKMTDLLTDIYLLEGYLLELQYISPKLRDSITDYYAGLLDRHDVTYQEFEQALSCYLLHEREMQQIHEDILQRFSIMESQVEPYMPDSQDTDSPEPNSQTPGSPEPDSQTLDSLQDSVPDHRFR